jgi:hypothetical protein
MLSELPETRLIWGTQTYTFLQEKNAGSLLAISFFRTCFILSEGHPYLYDSIWRFPKMGVPPNYRCFLICRYPNFRNPQCICKVAVAIIRGLPRLQTTHSPRSLMAIASCIFWTNQCLHFCLNIQMSYGLSYRMILETTSLSFLYHTTLFFAAW